MQCIRFHQKVQSSTHGERLHPKRGIDYEETFSPVVRFASIRLTLTIFTHLDLKFYQMDVETAFLIGELDEKTYIDQLVGFVANGEERKVCKL